MTPAPRLAIAILAAGAGSRFGAIKPLARLNGRTLLDITLEAARETVNAIPDAQCYLVLGAHADVIAGESDLRGVTVLRNESWPEGMATSIRLAATEAATCCDGLMLLTADQPLVAARDLRLLADTWRTTPQRMVAAGYAGGAGIPAIFPTRCFERLQALRGDRGAKSLLNDTSDRPTIIPLPEASWDADTPEALDAIRRQLYEIGQR